MFVFSHKMVFIKNETALLRVTMRERAREFVATISIKKFTFCCAHFKRILSWKSDISKK